MKLDLLMHDALMSINTIEEEVYEIDSLVIFCG